MEPKGTPSAPLPFGPRAGGGRPVRLAGAHTDPADAALAQALAVFDAHSRCPWPRVASVLLEPPESDGVCSACNLKGGLGHRWGPVPLPAPAASEECAHPAAEGCATKDSEYDRAESLWTGDTCRENREGGLLHAELVLLGCDSRGWFGVCVCVLFP